MCSIAIRFKYACAHYRWRMGNCIRNSTRPRMARRRSSRRCLQVPITKRNCSRQTGQRQKRSRYQTLASTPSSQHHPIQASFFFFSIPVSIFWLPPEDTMRKISSSWMIDNFIFTFVNVQRGVHPSTQFLYGDGVLSERDIVQLPAKWTRNAIPPIDGRLGRSNRLRYALSSSTQNHPPRP